MTGDHFLGVQVLWEKEHFSVPSQGKGLSSRYGLFWKKVLTGLQALGVEKGVHQATDSDPWVLRGSGPRNLCVSPSPDEVVRGQSPTDPEGVGGEAGGPHSPVPPSVTRDSCNVLGAPAQAPSLASLRRG